MVFLSLAFLGARNERLSGTDMSFERMSEFLSSYTLAMKQLKKYGRKKVSHHDEKSYHVTDSNFDSLCPKSGDYLCVVGMNVDEKGLKVLEKLAGLFVRDRFKMMYFLSSEKDSEINNKLKKEMNGSKVNSVVVLNRRKGRVSERDGGLENEDNARTFLESIISGSGRFVFLKTKI